MYDNNNGQYQQNQNQYYQPVPPTDPVVDECVDAAFSKCLASAIMCGFPVASIIAIFFGSAGLELVEKAKFMAAQRGARPGGKLTAASILGKIGKIAGIALTAFWGVYFTILFMFFACL